MQLVQGYTYFWNLEHATTFDGEDLLGQPAENLAAENWQIAVRARHAHDSRIEVKKRRAEGRRGSEAGDRSDRRSE